MANTKVFTIEITSTRTTLTYVDGITYTSPLRTAGSVYFSVAKVSYAGVETALTVTSNNSNPTIDSRWSITYAGDGYYKARYAFIPTYSTATTYAKYDSVVSGGVVYRSKLAANLNNAVTNTTWWEVISDGASIATNKGSATESLNCDTVIYERVFTANAQYGYGNCVSLNSMHTESDDEDISHDYDIFSLMLNAAITADERTETVKGELISRKIESRFANYIN